jgi:hypothetical protein
MVNRTSSQAVSSFFPLLPVLGLAAGGAMGLAQAARVQATVITFTGEELLVKPTDDSVTITIVSDTTIDYHYQYVASSRSYTAHTSDLTGSSHPMRDLRVYPSLGRRKDESHC